MTDDSLVGPCGDSCVSMIVARTWISLADCLFVELLAGTCRALDVLASCDFAGELGRLRDEGRLAGQPGSAPFLTRSHTCARREPHVHVGRIMMEHDSQVSVLRTERQHRRQSRGRWLGCTPSATEWLPTGCTIGQPGAT